MSTSHRKIQIVHKYIYNSLTTIDGLVADFELKLQLQF